MNTWNDQRVGEALSEHEIEQYMTAFRVGLIRIDADPDEASRIDALIARTDFLMIGAEVAATEAGVDQAVPPLAARAVDDAALDVAQLVRRAAKRDQWAWERLVDRYARLIWAVTKDFKLVESDAADVAQTTWLRLLEHFDQIEQHPDRVGSWLAATARNECLRCLAARKKVVLAEDDMVLEGAATPEPEIDERLLSDERAEAERAQMLHEALSRLPRGWQQMLELLMADPPASYAEISDQLGLPVGSIGPLRRLILARLRGLLMASGADAVL
jgi:RNA polymerase sigma factor (sigma-70 family)